MTKSNDNKILELKEAIAIKRLKLIEQSCVFTPTTNCIVMLDDKQYNINVLKSNDLKILATKLYTMHKASRDLGFKEENSIVLNGYKIDEWLNDICLKIKVISFQEEKKKLNKLESKLTEMLSKEKQVELEIDSIAELLKL